MPARDDFSSAARSPGGWGGQGNMNTVAGGGGHGSLGGAGGTNASGMGGLGGVGGGQGSNWAPGISAGGGMTGAGRGGMGLGGLLGGGKGSPKALSKPRPVAQYVRRAIPPEVRQRIIERLGYDPLTSIRPPMVSAEPPGGWHMGTGPAQVPGGVYPNPGGGYDPGALANPDAHRNQTTINKNGQWRGSFDNGVGQSGWGSYGGRR